MENLNMVTKHFINLDNGKSKGTSWYKLEEEGEGDTRWRVPNRKPRDFVHCQWTNKWNRLIMLFEVAEVISKACLSIMEVESVPGDSCLPLFQIQEGSTWPKWKQLGSKSKHFQCEAEQCKDRMYMTGVHPCKQQHSKLKLFLLWFLPLS